MSIVSVEESSIRKLCAGQVVTSLAAAVKELIENAIDSGAKCVEITVEQFGLGTVSVSDDGCGINVKGDCIEEDGSCTLLARRASSKQGSLKDPSSVAVGNHSSLGFRGEALHSLANVADVTLVTKTAESEACEVRYNVSENKSTCSPGRRQEVGTTVSFSNFFSSYPVRRRELEASPKKHFNTLVEVIKGWAVMCPQVRFYAIHRESPDAAPKTICITRGNGDARSAIATVFGGNLASTLEHVEWELGEGTGWQCVGFVSKVRYGRASPDRQMFTLDGRVVDLPRCAKTVSDAFAQCHPNADSRTTPALFLHFTSSNEATYDVNVAPDKRKVFVENETRVVVALREQALRVFQASSEGILVEKNRPAALVPVSASAVPLAAWQLQAALTPNNRKQLRNEVEENFGDFDARSSVKKAREEAAQYRTVATIDDSEGSQLQAQCEGGPERMLSFGFGDAELDVGSLPPLLFEEYGFMGGMKAQFERPCAGRDANKKKPPRKKWSHMQNSNACEAELTNMFSKTSFTEMIIHGQFNTGFIIASLKDELFIIDQHAADEKFNYERLMRQYVPKPQPLITPVRVALDPTERDIALQNREVLRQHGFDVEEESDPHSVRSDGLIVKSVPVLPYDDVTPLDVLELTRQLAQFGTVTQSLRAVWHSMATKACRSSIMVGTALDAKTMRAVVHNLASLEQPWACPHGRPTMRHLRTLDGQLGVPPSPPPPKLDSIQ